MASQLFKKDIGDQITQLQPVQKVVEDRCKFMTVPGVRIAEKILQAVQAALHFGSKRL